MIATGSQLNSPAPHQDSPQIQKQIHFFLRAARALLTALSVWTSLTGERAIVLRGSRTPA